jgi:hypothetical protein
VENGQTKVTGSTVFRLDHVDGWGEVFPEGKSVSPREKLCPSIRLLGKLLRGPLGDLDEKNKKFK